jgi:cytochrome c553
MKNKKKSIFILFLLFLLLIGLFFFFNKEEFVKIESNNQSISIEKKKDIHSIEKIDRTQNGKLKPVDLTKPTKEEIKKINEAKEKEIKDINENPLWNKDMPKTPRGKAQFPYIPKKDINGTEYNSFFYEEAPIKGKEPKWKFAEVRVKKRKFGDSTVVYSRCSKCHGRLGEKKAFGKAAPLKYLPSDLIFKRLIDYRDNELNLYGHGKLMHNMVKNMNDKDFNNLINQIKGLTEKTFSNPYE